MAEERQISRLRDDARAIFAAGVKAADPFGRTRTVLEANKDRVDDSDRVHVFAAGKAALSMVAAALEIVPSQKMGSAIAVTNPENARSGAVPQNVTLHIGGHPVPDAGGEAGARAIEAVAQAAAAGELVICLISGGASAILPAPVEGLTLADKIATTELLLKSGADIHAMNTVRTAMSRLKGGGLARTAAPASVLSLILSDVPGDDPATIASGPTVPRSLMLGEAWAVIEAHGLADRVPPSVRQLLESDGNRVETSADLPPPDVTNVIIGSNALSLEAARQDAARRGYETLIAASWLDGDVSDAAGQLLSAARSFHVGSRPVAILAGGETTVQVTGDGLGGRNLELAFRFAMGAADPAIERPWAMLSGGTDGRDGPTDAAGGVVDAGTITRMAAAGIDHARALQRNDAYHAIQASDDLLMTGATGTNVADLQIVLLG